MTSTEIDFGPGSDLPRVNGIHFEMGAAYLAHEMNQNWRSVLIFLGSMGYDEQSPEYKEVKMATETTYMSLASTLVQADEEIKTRRGCVFLQACGMVCDERKHPKYGFHAHRFEPTEQFFRIAARHQAARDEVPDESLSYAEAATDRDVCAMRDAMVAEAEAERVALGLPAKIRY
jgi:hypothetical protein